MQVKTLTRNKAVVVSDDGARFTFKMRGPDIIRGPTVSGRGDTKQSRRVARMALIRYLGECR